MGAYLGIDLHRRRSLAVCLNEEGETLWWRRFENSPANLAGIIEETGPGPEVAIETTWGWYWAADLITDMGGTGHLGHPLAIKGYENRRVKNDLADATLLADLLRMNRLPESWIAPDPIRQLRELVRLPAQAVADAHRVERPDPLGDGQRRHHPHPGGVVGSCRHRIPRLSRHGGYLYDNGRLAAGPGRHLRRGDQPARQTHPPTTERRHRLPGDPTAQRCRTGPHRSLHCRDRRCPQVPHSEETLLLVGTHPQGERVGSEVLSAADQQTRLPSGPLVSSRSRLPIPRSDQRSETSTREWRNDGAATSAGSPPPESFSPSSTTGYETERSDASETRRETVRTRSDCELARSADPTSRCGSMYVIEPRSDCGRKAPCSPPT